MYTQPLRLLLVTLQEAEMNSVTVRTADIAVWPLLHLPSPAQINV